MNTPEEQGILSLTNGLQHGEYYLGPALPFVSPSPVRAMKEYLAKNINTSEFVTMKILNLSTPHGDSDEDNQGKVILHNEHSILSILQDTPGVIRHHGLFKETQRIILVLSCVYNHDYDQDKKWQDYINLQHHVIQKKKLCERDAMRLFYLIAKTMSSIHEKNIIHRDLKLGNVVLNKRTQEITIMNFGLSKHLVREDDMLVDQRGSLAYVSPDILSGEPYFGKPSDIWSLGVLLYTMLFGQFPFYDDNPQELFKKIRNAHFSLPRNIDLSAETTFLISQLIEIDPHKRLSILEVVECTQSIYSRLSLQLQIEPMQIVPEVHMSTSSDCIVPDGDRSWPTETSNMNFTELSAPRLCLNPFIDSASGLPPGTFHFQSSPRDRYSPPSPSSPRIVFFSDNPSPLRNIPSYSSANPFVHSVSSPSSTSDFRSNQPSMTHDISQSLPIYLVSPNLNSSNVTSTTDRPCTPPVSSYQMHLHPRYMSSHSHRHSFSEGDTNSNLSPQTNTQHHHGRRSLGSMLGVIRSQRRHSHHNSPSPSYSMLNDESPRTRRRSHEPRDDEREILQGLQAAANRNIRLTCDEINP